MDSISLTEAEGRLSELIDRVEAGEEIDITRDGKAVARLSGVGKQMERKPFDFAGLKTFTDSLPMSKVSAADLVRSMRDGGY